MSIELNLLIGTTIACTVGAIYWHFFRDHKYVTKTKVKNSKNTTSSLDIASGNTEAGK